MLSQASRVFQQVHVQQNGLTPAETQRLADHAKWLAKARKIPTTVRPSLVRVVKAKVKASEYENNLKLTIATDRLLNDLQKLAA